MNARMDRLHVFECPTAPPQLRFAAQFLATTNYKGKIRHAFEPIVFQGPTAEYVRAYASRWVAEQEAKLAREIQLVEASKARAEERRLARAEEEQ